MKFSLNIPLFLTLLRLIISPLLLPILLVTFLPANIFSTNIMLTLLFVCLSLTDFLDGYLARKLGQETHLGRLLDPVADKFLVYTTLVALVQAHKFYYYWAIIIIGREFFVMGLREVALSHGFSVPVSKLGKLKTITQVLCLSWVIANPYHNLGYQAPFFNGVENMLIALTIGMTLYSGWSYYRSFRIQYNQV